jgi:hypothetical protein
MNWKLDQSQSRRFKRQKTISQDVINAVTWTFLDSSTLAS